MHGPSQASARRLGAILTAALVAAVVVGVTWAGAATNGVRKDTPCSPVAGHHNFEDPPSFVTDPSKYATCDDCRPIAKGTKCHLWWGDQTPDGGDGGVSHVGWPGLTGIRFQVTSDANNGATKDGTQFNDGLYGRHGSDKLYGEGGDDVIWGDSNISKKNGPHQKDVLDGGDGNDWIYASHGTNTITGGAGNDKIYAYYGKGTVDCGPGTDTVTVRHHTKYKLTGCEIIKYPAPGR